MHEGSQAYPMGNSADIHQQLQTLQARMRTLEQQIALTAAPPDALTQAFQELHLATTALQETITSQQRQHEQTHQQILDAIPDLIFVKNLDSQLIWANQALLNFCGMTLAEMQGMVDVPFNHPDYARQQFEDDATVFAPGQTLAVSEEVITRQDGTVQCFSTVKSPIVNDQGQMTHLVGVARDISQRKQAELALKRSEERFWHFAENSQAILWITPPTLRENIYVNSAYERIWGRSRQSLIDQPTSWLEAIHPEDRERISQRIVGSSKDGPIAEEYRIIRPDGSVRWIRDQAFPIHNEAGELYGYGGLAEDITDQKQLELSLQASEAKLNYVLDSAVVAIISYRFFADKHWHYDYCSPGCEAIYGYTAEEIMGDPYLFRSSILPEDRAIFLPTLHAAVFAELKTQNEFRIRRKDGSICWLSSIHVSKKITDNCWQVTAVNHDITPRKQAELELHKREAFLSSIYKGADQAIFVVEVTADQDFRYGGFNPIAERYGKISDSKVQGKTPEAAFGPDVGAKFRQYYSRCVKTRQSLTYEEWVTLETGGIWTLTRLTPLSDDQGNIYRLVGTALDITERKQAQQALQYQVSRDQLVASIAQDIRQSLNLETVLTRTVSRVQGLLGTDRVIICRYHPEAGWTVIKETVDPAYQPMLGALIADPCLRGSFAEPYVQGEATSIANVDQDPLPPRLVEVLRQYQVKANLVGPILVGNQLWGVIVAHQCSAPRKWDPMEMDLFKQLATQVSIAIQQSELYEQTQQQLKEIETIYHSAPIGLGALDPELRFVRANQYLADANGLSIADHLGRNTFEVVPQLAQQLEPMFRQVLTTGEPVLNVEISGETSAQPGVQRTWLESWLPLKNSEGQITGINLVVQEITQRKQRDAKIREQAALIEISPDAILVTDLNRRIRYWNRGAAKLYGWSPQAAIGQVAHQLLQGNEEIMPGIQQTLLDRGEWQGELAKVTKTGKKVLVDARWLLVRDDHGQPESILSVETDITTKKQIETQYFQAQRLETLGTLTSGIAHDLNNVLSPILTMAQLLQITQDNLAPTAREQLKLIEQSAKRGADMVKQILTLTRGSNEEPTLVSLEPLLQEVASVIRKSLPKTIAFELTWPEPGSPPPLPLTVMADATHLHQVMMNLCINARDAMPQGGLLTLAAQRVHLDAASAELHLDARVGHYVVITVADTGTGIAPELRDRIFDPFFTTKEPGKGTGLGLATVLGIVKNYGGFLQVFSEVGQGTQVKTYLPALEIAVDPTPLTPTSIQDGLKGHGEVVLVVDDDSAVRLTTRSLLEAHRYNVLTTKDGLEALGVYQRHQQTIRLVLLDVTMPNMSGVELIQRIKAINPSTKIIAISGLSTNRAPVEQAGATLFLPKPYPLYGLLEAVASLINTP